MPKRLIARCSMLVFPLLSLAACASSYPSHYSAEAISAKVIDAETREPLDGVIVVANWQLLGGIEGNYPVGQMQVLETQTGPDGVFRFPAWGPLKRPHGHLLDADPQLLLFKPGYEYQRLYNWFEVSWGRLREPVRRSDWNRRVITLKRFKGAIQAYEDHFEALNKELEHVATDDPKDCNWKKLPRTIVAISRERKLLEEKGINPHTLFSLDKELIANDEYYTKKGKASCGSPKVFLRSIQQ